VVRVEAVQPLALREPRYNVARVELTGAPPKRVELAFPADHFTYLGGSADLNIDRVRVAFNAPAVFVPLSKVTLVRAPAPILTSVWVDWDPSEQGKWFQFYYSGAPFIEIGANVVTIGGDTIGVAKEETLRLVKANLDRFQFTSDGSLKVTAVSAEVPNIDVPISTRASEATLSAIKAQTDKLTFTPDNRLRVDALVSVLPTVNSQGQAYYYATAPSETAEGWYNLRIDPAHRLYVTDDQALQLLTEIHYRLYAPGHAETFTTTPLGASAAYYGPTRDFLYSRLTTFGVMGCADQPSAADGVYVQLSLDGVNWDYKGATATLTAAGAVSLAQVVTARYARVVWVNGNTAQTVFRLGGRYMIAGSENPPLSLAPLRIDPVCSACGRDMTETGDFFVEDGKVYCPKCYANKRWKEVRDKREWVRSLKAWRRIAQGDEQTRAKDHTPDDAEDEVS
jgi:hypothetical protein